MRIFAAILLACSALAFAACGEDEPAVTGSAIPRSELGDHADELVDANRRSFKAQLAALKGRPVVVNQWASWCGPCRFEFPFFRSLAKKYAGEVSFIGLNSNDARGSARDFLEELPLGAPSFYDPGAAIARDIGGGRAWPTTVYYDSDGEKVKVHPGAYATEAKLQQDVEEHALGG